MWFFQIHASVGCGNVVAQSRNFERHHECVLALYVLGYTESDPENPEVFSNGENVATILSCECREPLGLFESNGWFYARVDL